MNRMLLLAVIAPVVAVGICLFQQGYIPGIYEDSPLYDGPTIWDWTEKHFSYEELNVETSKLRARMGIVAGVAGLATLAWAIVGTAICFHLLRQTSTGSPLYWGGIVGVLVNVGVAVFSMLIIYEGFINRRAEGQFSLILAITIGFSGLLTVALAYLGTRDGNTTKQPQQP